MGLLSVQGWGQTYKLVTSTSDLVAGEKYLIGSAQTGTTLLLSDQATNNRPQATGSATTITSSTVTVTPATTSGETSKPYELTLGGTSGAWTLTDVANSINLQATSSSANYLKSGSGTWTITFTSNAAVITCTNGGSRNIIRYNSGSTLFSCYASGQAAVYLYRKTFKVTYDGNGSTSGTVPTDATTYFSGVTVTTKTNSGTLAKAGFSFSGWNTKADGSGTDYTAGSGTFAISMDTVLYAKWTAAGGKTITYNGNGNTGGTAPIDTPYTSGATVTVLGAGSLAKTGHTFTGWNSKADSSGVNFAVAATFSIVKDTTLYAKWKINNYTVSFDANGGTGSPSVASVNGNYNSSVTLASIGTLAKTGYAFDGWNTATDGSGTDYAAASSYTVPASNVTLYAKWTANNYTVTFDGNGSTGGSTATQTIAYTASAALNANGYTKTGYSFDGWATTAGGSVAYADGATYTMGLGNVTLFAKWSVYVGPCQTDNFDASYGNWTLGSGTYNNSGAGYTGNGVGFNSTNDDIITTNAISGSSSISFIASASSGTANFTMKVQYSTSSSGSWTDISTISANGSNTGDVTTTWNTFNIAISPSGTYYLRFLMSARSGGSCYLDDVDVFCSSLPEIDLRGNNVSITNGSSSPATSNHTDFGSTAVAGGTVVRTFKILNTGSDTLKLTGTTPFVTLSGANAADFSVTTTPASIILAGDSTSFQVTFDPSAAGVRNADISIANNDSDENPYTFNIKGTGINSNLSDIIEGGTSYTSNHDYTLYQATPIASTANSVGVFKFTIRDGGVAASDADAFGTELNAISFNVTNIANIRTAALFGGVSQSTLVANTPTINTSTGKISFTGLSGANVRAADNGTKDLTLRVSYLTTVTDNAQLQYSIDTATANPDSSIFAAINAGGATSSTSGDRNRIEVTADRLAFGTQPTNGTINTNLAAFSINAVDSNGNRDLDASKSITLTTSGTTMTSSSPYSLSAGTLSISDVQYSTVQSGITLTGTTTGYTINTIASNPFDVTDVVIGTYRTLTGGTWPTGGTATWERYTSSGWASATPAANTTDLLIIRHVLTSRASFASSSPYTSMTVINGGSFTSSHNCTFSTLLIENGGTFIASDPAVDIHSSGTLTVDSGGLFVINSSTLNHLDGLFDGTENFKHGSTVEVRKYDNDSSPGEDDLVDSRTSISANSLGYYFGNLYINFTNENGKAFTLVGIIGAQKLCSGDLTIANQDASYQVQLTNVSADIEIGGSVIVTKNKFAFGGVTSSTLTHTVKGNIEVNGAGAIIDLNSTSSGSASVLVNLEGDLIGTVGTIQSVDGGCGIAFINTSIQNINVADAVPYNNINTYVKKAANVQLFNNNLKLNSNSTFTVEKGGTFNFNWVSGTTPLLIVNGASGTNTFTSLDSSILKITHLSGLVKNTANAGNVQLSVSNKTFSQSATFLYIGKANQVTGDAITIGSSGKNIICELIDNNTQLSFTNSTYINNATTASPTGGKLDIRKGQVIESTSAYIIGSTGTLYMSSGTLYQVAKGNATPATSVGDLIPRIDGVSFAYNLQGGTIELAGSGASEAFQTLRGSRTYKNIKYSGANTYLTDYKNLSSGVTIDSSLIITATAVVDCIKGDSAAVSFIGTGGFVMDGGRIRFKKVDDAQPELTATATTPARSYNVTGGTVEFYNSGAAQNQRLRATDGNSNTISYQNIDIKATAANTQSGADFFNVTPTASFGIKGTLTVDSPAVFRLDKGNNVSGTGNINAKAGSTLLYGSSNGIKTSGIGTSDGNIRISGTRTFPTTASYGFVGTGAMVTGDGLPASMVNMYVNKGASGDSVTLTNSAEVKGVIHFKSNGRIVTNGNLLYESDTATGAIIGAASSGTNNFVQGNLQRKIASDSTYNFPIGLDTLGAQPFTITPTGTSGSTILGYMETNSSSPKKTVAYCDLETKTAPGQQVGQGTAGADGALDQITFNLASPLQWDVTNPSGGITTYNITAGANGGQDISPVTSAGGTAVRYLMKNGEPGNTGFATGSGGSDFPTVGFIACPNGYSLSGMTSFSKFTLDGASASNTALPVKLTYFTAKRVENRSQLDWATSLEIDNDRFEIERSADAVSFELMGTVKGAGNTTAPQTYRLFDEAPLQGWNYYRLKQIDFDGKFEYSQMVALYFDGENFSIVLYPNPTKGQFTLESFGEAKIFDAAIFNTLGQEIRKVKTGVVNHVEDLAAGNYFIKIKADNQIITKKLIIQ